MIQPVTAARTVPIGGPPRWQSLTLLALLLVIGVWATRDLAHRIPTIETWISSHGWLGPVVFIGMVVVLTSIFVPDTVFAVIAGVLFGLAGGTLVMIVAGLCTAAVNFALARLFLRRTVCRALAHRPRLAAIHQAVASEGLRFQFLLRLTPINPVAVSYVLGASDTRFPTFLSACAGMIPTIAVEVYFGHAARHVAAVAGGVSERSSLHTMLTLTGLILSLAVLLYTTRIARKALQSYEPVEAKAENGVDPDLKTSR